MIENQENFKFSETLIKINNPLISIDEKIFFLKKYISPHTEIHFDGKNNIVKIDIVNSKAELLQEKLMNRVGDYLKNGTISLGSISLGNHTKKEALSMLKKIIDKINIQFDMYVRSNHSIMNRIGNQVNKGIKEFDEYYNKLIEEVLFKDEENSQIENKETKKSNKNKNKNKNNIFFGIHKDFKPHDFSLKFNELCNKRMLWCNAFATGLGKTSTALLVVQSQQNQNKKRKTIITVPNSTLSKWHKETFVGVEGTKDEDATNSKEKNKNFLKAPVYDEILEDECLFINLVKPSQYKNKKNNEQSNLVKYLKSKPHIYDYLSLNIDDQLELIKDKKYKKIFMSHEDFYRIRLKENTLLDYIKYLEETDSDFALSEFSEGNQFNKKVEQLYDVLHNETIGKNKKNIFFEDLNIDSIVIDEGHIYKNSKESFSSSINRIKYLSNPPASARGIDMLAKTHYIRRLHNDGILSLTATPITNSPIEIYSKLSLVLGEYFINKLLNINSLNEFITLFCIIESDEDYAVDGEEKTFELFKGLSSLKMLRQAINRCIVFLDENNDEVKSILKLPEKKENAFNIEMSKYQNNKINIYKNAYQICKQLKYFIENNEEWTDKYQNLLNSPEYSKYVTPVLNKFNEPIYIAASPFNFISKMERLILDEDLNEQATIMFINKKFKKQIQNAIEKFNNKKFKQKFSRLNVHTDKNAIISIREEIDENSDNIKTIYEFFTQGKIIDLEEDINKKYDDIINYIMINYKNNEDNRIDFDEDLMILLDTVNHKEQLCFYELLSKEIEKTTIFKKQNKDIDNFVNDIMKFNISNKVKKIIDEIIYEDKNPRGILSSNEKTNLVKQIVFCDQLGIHFKLKHLVFNKLKKIHKNLELNKIQIVTGQYNSTNEEIQNIQDGFNAENEENQYQIIIANQKCQEGIDLQIGTQAIHHSTIGWTPDSLKQRNGRAVRQGNKTEFVNVNYYDMTNTFDVYKRNLVNKKEEWINELIFNDDKDYVEITQMLSKEQQNKMIELIGNQYEGGLTVEEYQEKIIKENIEKEKRITKEKQKIYLDFLINNNESNDTFLNKEQINEKEYISHYIKEYRNKSIEEQENIFDLIKSDEFENIRKSILNNENEFYINKDKIKDEEKEDVFNSLFKLINSIKNKNVIAIKENIVKNQNNLLRINFKNNQNKITGLIPNKEKRKIKTIILINDYLNNIVKKITETENDKNKKEEYIEIFKKIETNILTNKDHLNVELFNKAENIKNNKEIKEIVHDINTLSKDIKNMSIKGFQNISKNNNYAYYPIDIIDEVKENPEKVFYYQDVLVYPKGLMLSVEMNENEDNIFIDRHNNNKNISINEKTMEMKKELQSNSQLSINQIKKQTKEEIFKELKEIVDNYQVTNDNYLFEKGDKIIKYLTQNKITIFNFNKKCEKAYPIERKPYIENKDVGNKIYEIKLDNRFDNQYKEKSKTKIIQDNITIGSNKWNDVVYYNFEILSNNQNYQLLKEVILLIEFYYIVKMLNSDYENKEKNQNVLNEKNQFNNYNFSYLNFDCYLKQNEKLVNKEIIELSIKNIEEILNDKSYINEKYIKEYGISKTDFEIEVASSNKFVTQNNFNISKMNNKDFVIFDHEDSYEMYSKYKYRQLSTQMLCSCYFYKHGNLNINYRNEKEAFEILRKNNGFIKENHNKWILSVQVAKLIIYRMYLNKDIKGLTIKKLSGETIDEIN